MGCRHVIDCSYLQVSVYLRVFFLNFFNLSARPQKGSIFRQKKYLKVAPLS
ncbi:hypothetical protein Runsl_4726 [Runella slithyformis DSM 19594]|uniref:Uncharacterized protein n=1 Tax=Runella slithyformis (strain ATCC 29530 / DSM 19594 / LMG 11500 / NCIMB 11436 / LSU 4) TaxID=761193 RepID=A0A7U4E8A1_RUNSL|nr:hypothetical protein Runsl_4726 [Runella slithyformis DSM 19594]